MASTVTPPSAPTASQPTHAMRPKPQAVLEDRQRTHGQQGTARRRSVRAAWRPARRATAPERSTMRSWLKARSANPRSEARAAISASTSTVKRNGKTGAGQIERRPDSRARRGSGSAHSSEPDRACRARTRPPSHAGRRARAGAAAAARRCAPGCPMTCARPAVRCARGRETRRRPDSVRAAPRAGCTRDTGRFPAGSPSTVPRTGA